MDHGNDEPRGTEDAQQPNSKEEPNLPDPPSRRYSNYVLVVLILVYVFNFVDRQILSILAEDIKADLGLSDADIALLYGTVFAVFYAIFGIPLSRLADMWVRKNLISVGLVAWSAMTALSGTARSFTSLAAFRIGVGVGESSATPAAFSLLGDYFPPKLRATAMALYSSGVYIGSGIGIVIGGLVVDNWNRVYADGGAPFGLVGWQAAFFAVGLPGIVLAVWVWTLREPIRGLTEGLVTDNTHPHPFLETFKELGCVLPPFTLLSLAVTAKKHNRSPFRLLRTNLAIAAACAAAAWILTTIIGNKVQWIALGIGVYSFFSWLQGLKLRDPGAFAMIYRSRAIVLGMIGFAWLAFVGYGLGFWAAPYLQRAHGLSAGEVGAVLGPLAALGGLIGVASGGFFSDWLRARNGKGRLLAGMLCAALSLPSALGFIYAESLTLTYIFHFIFSVMSSFWIGSAAALCNELVVPRMRATASSYYILAVTFIGLALGPFTMGQVSTRLTASGQDPVSALRSGIQVALLAYGLAVLFLYLASRSVEQEEATRLDRARAVGEAV